MIKLLNKIFDIIEKRQHKKQLKNYAKYVLYLQKDLY